MSVAFLIDQQERHYGHRAGGLSAAHADGYFFLDDNERALHLEDVGLTQRSRALPSRVLTA